MVRRHTTAGIYKNLAALGFRITFADPDAFGRQQHRDDDDFSYANVIVYKSPQDIPALLDEASEADLVIKHSGVGVGDALLEERVLQCKSSATQVAFWDVDAPATLENVEKNRTHPFRGLIPEYDYVFTYGGGPPVVEHYLRLGARECHPIYNALDPETHHAVSPDPELACDLVFVGNRLPDREHRVEEFFFAKPRTWLRNHLCSWRRGLGREKSASECALDRPRWHQRSQSCELFSAHGAEHQSPDSMAHVGFSPPTRVFEAAGAGACLITDQWDGIEMFFDPVAKSW